MGAYSRLPSSALQSKSYSKMVQTSTQLRCLKTYSTGPRSSPETAPPPTTPSTPLQPVSKRKADFHPPPRKVDASALASESQPNPPKPPPKPPTPSAPAPSEKAPVELSKEAEFSASAIQMAIEDMRKAQQHGILVPPPEGAGKIKSLFHQGKELFKFYYRGLKLIGVHRKTVNDIQARLAAEKAAGREPRMTRWESQFIRTYHQDLVKLVPFLLIVLILEEVIPLVVMYVPGLLPSTCILPSQLERIQSKAEVSRKEALISLKTVLKQVNSSDLKKLASIQELDGNVVKQLCRAFGRSSWGPTLLARRRLGSHLEYLKSDDALLAAEGKGIRLSVPELRNALWERGFVLEGTAESALRNQLATWVSKANSDPQRVALVIERATR